MVVKRQCSFCAAEIEPGTGTMFVKRDGTVFHFCSSSCRKQQLHLGRVGHRFKWTRAHALKVTADRAGAKGPSPAPPAAVAPSATKGPPRRGARRKAPAAPESSTPNEPTPAPTPPTSAETAPSTGPSPAPQAASGPAVPPASEAPAASAAPAKKPRARRKPKADAGKTAEKPPTE